MRWINNLNEKLKQGMRSWLNVQAPQRFTLTLNNMLDWETNCIKNEIWYRGDSNELSELYKQLPGNDNCFWKAVPTKEIAIRKIHTGLPGNIVSILTALTLADLNGIVVDNAPIDLWQDIEAENNFTELLNTAVQEALVCGDGAFRVSFDTVVTNKPIIEWFSGDKCEFVYNRGRLNEIIFKSRYSKDNTMYVLLEHYGYGYVTYELLKDNDKPVPLTVLPQTADLANAEFSDNLILAVPFMVYKSNKYTGRGKSIFDAKADSFDSFDEIYSQWMDAVRHGRPIKYIPDNMLPRDPGTGEVILRSSPFDNAFISLSQGSMAENGSNDKITTEQPNIPHESYLASYCTALDLCLQGIISPSTLGIDTKKLDNAEAQREKEKTTLYTRNAIVSALQKALPKVVNTALNAHNILHEQEIDEYSVDVPFGEYANPSFESQVETVAKAKQGGIMSIEASVDELYGDTRDDEWKAEEVERLKSEQGIAVEDDPSLADKMPVIGFDGGVDNES